jgi:hypothetical protein
LQRSSRNCSSATAAHQALDQPGGANNENIRKGIARLGRVLKKFL